MGVDVHFIFGSNSFQFLAVRGDRVGGIFHLGRNLGPIRLDFWYFGALELIGSLFGRNFGSNSFQFLVIWGDRVGGILHLGRNLGPIRLDFWYFGALELIGSLFSRNFGSIRLNFWCFGVLELIGSPILKGFFGGTGQKFGFEMNLILTT